MKKIIKRLSILVIFFTIILICCYIVVPKPVLLQNTSFSSAIYDDDNHLLRLTLSADQQYRLFTPLEKIPNDLIDATLLQEDQFFYFHPGVNPSALIKAAWLTYVGGGRRIGGSTISMQLARLLYGMNSKTPLGKLEQIFRALQLELFYSKNQILEAYLNLAPYGGNVQGAGAASLVYFHKNLTELNLPEILTLVVIPQNPVKRLPTITQNQLLKSARDRLYERWLKKNPQDKNQQALMALPLQLKTVNELPFLAPHFVDWILTTDPIQGEIKTTLDLRSQITLEKLIRKRVALGKNQGIENAAALLIDARDNSIKAWVGSADFFNATINGQVNGVLAKRSPGSTLKPFIYALAIDQGIIHPLTVLKDAPAQFGAYNPENFDQDFIGPVSAKNALILSRNIPAIELMQQLNQPSFYEFLNAANISRLKSADYYGLSLALGGAELNMLELASLYAMLANGGDWKLLHALADKKVVAEKKLLSPESSFLVLEMLKDNARPEKFYSASDNNQELPVYWKTGTSSGYLDAWSVGIFGHYVLVVWVGDFNNRKYANFIGQKIAAPLFFDIVNAIHYDQPNLKTIQPDPKQLNLTQVAICEASGLLPTDFCPKVTQGWFIPGVSPIKKDNIFREIAIDKATGLRSCKIDENTEFKIYEFWPSDLQKIFAEAGFKRSLPPEFNADCDYLMLKNTDSPPKIISPQANQEYLIRYRQHETLALIASANADVKKIYWFANQAFIGESRPNEIFNWPAKSGNYLIRAVDEFGQVASVQVNIEILN